MIGRRHFAVLLDAFVHHAIEHHERTRIIHNRRTSRRERSFRRPILERPRFCACRVSGCLEFDCRNGPVYISNGGDVPRHSVWHGQSIGKLSIAFPRIVFECNRRRDIGIFPKDHARIRGHWIKEIIAEIEPPEHIPGKYVARVATGSSAQITTERKRIGDIIVAKQKIAPSITGFGAAEKAQEIASAAEENVVVKRDLALPELDLAVVVLVFAEWIVAPAQRSESEDIVVNFGAIAEVLDLERFVACP